MESTHAVSARESRALSQRPIVHAPAAPRRRAVCPVCQDHKPVRVSGVMAKHRTYWGVDCSGAGATPVPVRVAEADLSPAGAHDAKLLDRWDFLSLPLLVLLHTTRAEVREAAEPGLVGTIRAMPAGCPWRWVVRMPVGGDALDHDLVVRALLAAAHGVDISDWPTSVAVREA
jgi:hypothetical protein